MNEKVKSRDFFSYIAFTLVATVPIVIASENMFYYVSEPLWSNIFWYALATAATFWSIQYYSIRRIAPLFLAGSFFGFIIEGVLVPLIYGHPIFISWTPLAWHASLSFILIWYYFRKWSLVNSWFKIAISSSALGIFWATWSLVLWLPSGTVPEGEEIANQLIKSSNEFTLYAFTYGLILIIAHLVMGFFWPKCYTPGKLFNIIIAIVLTGYFFLNIVIISSIFWAPIYLGMLLGILWIALSKNKRTETEPNVFVELAGQAKIPSLIAMLALPIMASVTYWFMTLIQPTPEAIFKYVFEGYPIVMLFIGFWLFGWAYYRTIRPKNLKTDK